MTLIFGMDDVGQGHRSKVKVKCQKSCFDITVPLLQGQGQRPVSRSKVAVKVKGQGKNSAAQWSILGAQLCRVQQRATTPLPVYKGSLQ